MHNWNQSGPLTARLESSVENPWPVSSSQQEWWAEVSGVATAWMWYERRIESFISILMKVSLLPFFQQCSPWPDVPYQMNNAPSPSYNSSPNSFNLGDGYVTNKCFIFPVDTVAFVCMCFVRPCISYPGRRGQGPPFLEWGEYFPQSLLRPSVQEFPVTQTTLCMSSAYVVAGRWTSEDHQGNSCHEFPILLFCGGQRTHHDLYQQFPVSSDRNIRGFQPSAPLQSWYFFLPFCPEVVWGAEFSVEWEEILSGAKQPGFWEAIPEQRANRRHV